MLISVNMIQKLKIPLRYLDAQTLTGSISPSCFLLENPVELSDNSVCYYRHTHPRHYLQPLSIRGDLGDLVVDPVDKVCITCRQKAILREEKRTSSEK